MGASSSEPPPQIANPTPKPVEMKFDARNVAKTVCALLNRAEGESPRSITLIPKRQSAAVKNECDWKVFSKFRDFVDGIHLHFVDSSPSTLQKPGNPYEHTIYRSHIPNSGGSVTLTIPPLPWGYLACPAIDNDGHVHLRHGPTPTHLNLDLWMQRLKDVPPTHAIGEHRILLKTAESYIDAGNVIRTDDHDPSSTSLLERAHFEFKCPDALFVSVSHILSEMDCLCTGMFNSGHLTATLHVGVQDREGTAIGFVVRSDTDALSAIAPSAHRKLQHMYDAVLPTLGEGAQLEVTQIMIKNPPLPVTDSVVVAKTSDANVVKVALQYFRGQISAFSHDENPDDYLLLPHADEATLSVPIIPPPYLDTDSNLIQNHYGKFCNLIWESMQTDMIADDYEEIKLCLFKFQLSLATNPQCFFQTLASSDSQLGPILSVPWLQEDNTLVGMCETAIWLRLRSAAALSPHIVTALTSTYWKQLVIGNETDIVQIQRIVKYLVHVDSWNPSTPSEETLMLRQPPVPLFITSFLSDANRTSVEEFRREVEMHWGKSMHFKILLFVPPSALTAADLRSELRKWMPLGLEEVRFAPTHALLPDATSLDSSEATADYPEKESPFFIVTPKCFVVTPEFDPLPHAQAYHQRKGPNQPEWSLLASPDIVVQTDLMEGIINKVKETVKQRPSSMFISSRFSGSGLTTSLKMVAKSVCAECYVAYLAKDHVDIDNFERRLEVIAANLRYVSPSRPVLLVADAHYDHKSLFPIFKRILDANRLCGLYLGGTNQERHFYDLNPILSERDMTRMATSLSKVFEGNHKEAIESAVEYALRNPEVSYNRHIYVLALAATKGVFKPCDDWIQELYDDITSCPITMAYAEPLLLLSAFAPANPITKRSLPSQYYDWTNPKLKPVASKLKPTAKQKAVLAFKELFYDHNQDVSRSIACLHPFFARLFIQKMCSPFDDPFLRAGCIKDLVVRAAAHIRAQAPADTFISVGQSLLSHHYEEDQICSMLLERILAISHIKHIKPGSDRESRIASSINNSVARASDSIKAWELTSSFEKLMLSKCHKLLYREFNKKKNLLDALTLGTEAQALLKNDNTYVKYQVADFVAGLMHSNHAQPESVHKQYLLCITTEGTIESDYVERAKKHLHGTIFSQFWQDRSTSVTTTTSVPPKRWKHLSVLEELMI